MPGLDLGKLDKILKDTVLAISSGKERMFEVAEASRRECLVLEKDYEALKKNLEGIFQNIDYYETELKNSKKYLAYVNINYDQFSEEEKKEAYLTADKFRINLAIEREREQMELRARRDLENRIRFSRETFKKASDMMNHVGVALNFINGDLNDISTQIEDINNRNLWAIKVLETQEQDRKKIAREIHDTIAQSMSNVVTKAELCNKISDSSENIFLKEQLIELKSITRESLSDIRRIIYDLRPMILDDLGLIPTLQRHIDKLSKESNLKIEFEIKGIRKELPGHIETTLFRIVQESLNNTIKHSHAKKAKIQLFFSENNIELFVRDNGIGFDTEILDNLYQEDSGYGIHGMRERVVLLGGVFSIKSRKDEGTTCIVKIEI